MPMRNPRDHEECKSGACCRGEIRTVAANHKLSAIPDTRHRLTYRQHSNQSASSSVQATACQRGEPSPAVTHETSVVYRTRSFGNFTKHPAILSPVDYRSLTRCGISTSLKLRDNPRAKFHRGTFPGHGLRQKIRPESIAFRGIAPPFVRSGPFISSVRSEQHRMIELIQVIRHAEARPRLMAFT